MRRSFGGSGVPPECKYYLEGTCKYGSSCKFRHVNPKTSSTNEQVATPSKQENINIKPEQVIFHDLKEVHMDWKLSCYGLNLDWNTGNNILHGDYSPEEMRCEAYYQSRSFGNLNNYLELLARFTQENQVQRNVVLSDITGAIIKARTPRTIAHIPSVQSTAASVPTHAHAPAVGIVNQTALAPMVEFELGSIPEIL